MLNKYKSVGVKFAQLGTSWTSMQPG